MASEIDRADKALARIDLEKCKKEVADAERALALKKAKLAAIIQAKGAAGANGQADPTAPGLSLVEQVRKYLESHRDPVTPADIAAAIGLERAQVQPVLYRRKDLFRQVAEGWKLR